MRGGNFLKLEIHYKKITKTQTFSSISGTRDRKSIISLLLIESGARNFFVNLFIPHNNIR